MEIVLGVLLQHTITFFAIIDPIGVSAIMLSILSSNSSKNEISNIANKVAITITITFFVVLFAGNLILQLFGIDTDSLKVMGGIVLILTALSMLQGVKQAKTQEEKTNDELAIIPIAIPITFGPGIFSTIIILKDQSQNFMDILPIIIAFMINVFFVYTIFKNSIYIKHYLGTTGQNIITKLMGLIVGAIAVQFILSGSTQLVLEYIKLSS